MSENPSCPPPAGPPHKHRQPLKLGKKLGLALAQARVLQQGALQSSPRQSRKAARARPGAVLNRSTEWRPLGLRSRGRRLQAGTARAGAALTR